MTKKTLLIVDDEVEIRSVLQETLADLVDEVFLAENGEEAVKILLANEVTAVITDLNMPRMGGIELIKIAKSHGMVLPFVILTAYGDKGTAVEALKLGAFDFLDKPWEIDNVRDVVGRAIELGKEIQFWANFPDQKGALQDFSKENADYSQWKLSQLIKKLSRAGGGEKN